MKDKGIKIGQIESDAQVQPGYLSRIEKNPGKTTPSLEFVYTASKELDTSIDFLVDGHYDRYGEIRAGIYEESGG